MMTAKPDVARFTAEQLPTNWRDNHNAGFWEYWCGDAFITCPECGRVPTSCHHGCLMAALAVLEDMEGRQSK